MLIVLSAITTLIIFWFLIFILSNDFTIPAKDITKFKNILVIFPHADDEILHCGGLLTRLAKNRANMTLVILTKGEKGTPSGHLDSHLKKVRVNEAEMVAARLGVQHLIQKDFGDGSLIIKRKDIEAFLDDVIDDNNPQLVITYDLAGLYGHEDHIVCSEVVTKIVKKRNIILWYASFPKRLLSMAKLPEHMAKSPEYANKRTIPNIKVFIGLDVINKIRGVYEYKSQLHAFRSTVPFGIPLWLIYSAWIYEYFHEV